MASDIYAKFVIFVINFRWYLPDAFVTPFIMAACTRSEKKHNTFEGTEHVVLCDNKR